MKKFLIIVLIAAMLVVSVGCGQGSQTKNGSEINAFNELIRTFQVSSTSPLAFSAKESSFIKATKDDEEIMKSVRAEAYFIKFLLEDENYVIDGKIDDCEIYDGGEGFRARMQISSVSEKNRIEAVLRAEEMNTGDIYYILFQLDYDFEKDVLNAYTVYAYMPGVSADLYRYEQEELKLLSKESDDYEDFVAEVKAQQKAFMEKKSDITGHDYSAPYVKAMGIAFSRADREGAGVYQITVDVPGAAHFMTSMKDGGKFDTRQYNQMIAHHEFSSPGEISNLSKWYTGEPTKQQTGTAEIEWPVDVKKYEVSGATFPGTTTEGQPYSEIINQGELITYRTFTQEPEGGEGSLSDYVYIGTVDIFSPDSDYLPEGTLRLGSFELAKNNLYSFIFAGDDGYTEINRKGEKVKESDLVHIGAEEGVVTLVIYAYMNGEDIDNEVYINNQDLFSKGGSFNFHLTYTE